MPSKHFQDLLKKMEEVHIKKNADYANDQDSFSNFKRAAVLASWFTNPVDQVFASLIGVKLARLAELESGKTPNNEAIDDTYLDLTNYCGLWAAYKLSLRELDIANHPIYPISNDFILISNDEGKVVECGTNIVDDW